MPRRPIRHRQKYQPLMFSSFARSIARLNSISTVNRQKHDFQVHEKKLPGNSAGGGLMKNNMEIKNEESESSDEEEFDELVPAEFLFFDPKPEDFHGVKTLLQTYLDDKEWDLSGFVDLILEQTTVGAVVKLEKDEDNGIFSVVSALNFGRYKDNKCILELKKFLLRVCKEKDIIGNLRLLLGEEAHSVGLLVSHRVINLPPQLLPHIYDGLFNEVSWATEDEPTEELQNSFRFKFYIVVSKIYKLIKHANKKRRQNNDSDEEIVYVKPEDEIFHKLSSWSFSFPLQTQRVEHHELRNYRQMGLVMAIEAGKISTFLQELKSSIDES
ncbi:hypothetical protein FNV43_RR26897 [Rhamnella rubrinervis]|uniref:Protein BCCIP homolog n=1 Tax=Rhamnella rubrinervis TaxID=2594499 RepID=A0A8K0DNF5_9ROSA|nr:hypothetical protein FNV43_RR26897 [Rhamnella rubrinervis]